MSDCEATWHCLLMSHGRKPPCQTVRQMRDSLLENVEMSTVQLTLNVKYLLNVILLFVS